MVCERAGRGHRDAGVSVAIGVVWSVNPDVGSVGLAVIGPDAVGLESVVEAAENAQIVACSESALIRMLVIERHDVIEVRRLCGDLAAREGAGAVATSAEADERVGWGVSPSGVGRRVGEFGE